MKSKVIAVFAVVALCFALSSCNKTKTCAAYSKADVPVEKDSNS